MTATDQVDWELRFANASCTSAMTFGLTLARSPRPAEAVAELKRAAALAPESARYMYVHAIALNSSGKRSDALRLRRDNERRHPADRNTLFALVNLLREQDDGDGPLRHATRLAELPPWDPRVTALLQSPQQSN